MQTDVLSVIMAAFGTPQGGLPSLTKREPLLYSFTTDQAFLVDFLAYSVMEWSLMVAGNAKRPIIQKMDGSKPISTTVNGNMPAFDKIIVV